MTKLIDVGPFARACAMAVLVCAHTNNQVYLSRDKKGQLREYTRALVNHDRIISDFDTRKVSAPRI